MPSANAAINWFNKKEFDPDHVIAVSLAEMKIPVYGVRGRGRGGGGGGDRGRGGGGFDRSGPKGRRSHSLVCIHEGFCLFTAESRKHDGRTVIDWRKVCRTIEIWRKVLVKKHFLDEN